MIWLLCMLLSTAAASARDELREAVEDFWNALEDGDKARAMRFVHPDDLSKFLHRDEPAIEGWELEGIEALASGEASVTISFSRHMPGGAVLPVQAVERWERVDSAWKVRVKSEQEYRKALSEALSRAPRLPPRLDVFPRELKFPIGAEQPAVIVIRNGLDREVAVEGLAFDDGKFEVAKFVEEVAPRSVARIALHYKGREGGENLPAVFRLELKVDGETRRLEIPAVYNYVDPVLDWLKGQKRPAPARPPRQR